MVGKYLSGEIPGSETKFQFTIGNFSAAPIDIGNLSLRIDMAGTSSKSLKYKPYF